MRLSPDTERILEAINIIKGGASIVPEDIDAAVNLVLSSLGRDVIMDCIGMNPDVRRAYLLGYARCLDKNKWK